MLLIMGISAFGLVAHSAFRNLSSQKKEQSVALANGATLPANLSIFKVGGGSVSLSEFSGKVLVLNFWAGWCAPCLHEMPGLYAFYRRLNSKGLEVIALNMDDDAARGMDVLLKKTGQPPFPVFKGAESELADRFQLEGLPFTVVVDRGGRIVYSRAGEIDWAKSETVTLIEELL